MLYRPESYRPESVFCSSLTGVEPGPRDLMQSFPVSALWRSLGVVGSTRHWLAELHSLNHHRVASCYGT